jgi:hypothetical protein
VGADGKTSYQAEACNQGAKQSSVEIRASAGISAGQSSLAHSEVTRIVSLYRACAAANSEWADAHERAFDQWRHHHAAAYQAFENDPEAVRRVKEYVAAELKRYQGMSPRDRSGFGHTYCWNDVSKLLAVPSRGPEPDYFEIYVGTRVCQKVAVQDDFNGLFNSWVLRTQVGLDKFRKENQSRISKAIDDRIAQFERADTAGKARTAQFCRVDVRRMLEAA